MDCVAQGVGEFVKVADELALPETDRVMVDDAERDGDVDNDEQCVDERETDGETLVVGVSDASDVDVGVTVDEKERADALFVDVTVSVSEYSDTGCVNAGERELVGVADVVAPARGDPLGAVVAELFWPKEAVGEIEAVIETVEQGDAELVRHAEGDPVGVLFAFDPETVAVAAGLPLPESVTESEPVALVDAVTVGHAEADAVGDVEGVTSALVDVKDPDGEPDSVTLSHDVADADAAALVAETHAVVDADTVGDAVGLKADADADEESVTDVDSVTEPETEPVFDGDAVGDRVATLGDADDEGVGLVETDAHAEIVVDAEAQKEPVPLGECVPDDETVRDGCTLSVGEIELETDVVGVRVVECVGVVDAE